MSTELPLQNHDPQNELNNLLRKFYNYERFIRRFERISRTPNAYPMVDITKESKRVLKFGLSLANEIEKFAKSGGLEEVQRIYLEKAKENVLELSKVEGISPIRAFELFELGVENVEDLFLHTDKLTRQQIIGLEHFEDLLKDIPIEEVHEYYETLKTIFRTDNQYEIFLCGEGRRMKKNCKQIDFIFKLNFGSYTMKDISESLKSIVVDVICLGNTKLTAVAKLNKGRTARKISLRICNIVHLPCLLLYHTGPTDFVRKVAKRGIENGYYLCEYSIKRCNKNGGIGEPIIVESEKEIFDLVGYPYTSPEQRK